MEGFLKGNYIFVAAFGDLLHKVQKEVFSLLNVNRFLYLCFWEGNDLAQAFRNTTLLKVRPQVIKYIRIVYEKRFQKLEKNSFIFRKCGLPLPVCFSWSAQRSSWSTPWALGSSSHLSAQMTSSSQSAAPLGSGPTQTFPPSVFPLACLDPLWFLCSLQG